MTVLGEEIKKLVVARIQTMPPTMKLSIGSSGSFSKDELIRHVELDDAVGKKIVEMHMKYLREIANQ